MKHISLSIIALICIFLGSASGISAQNVVGQRDYFESVGGAAASANTISHFLFNKPTTVFLDPSSSMSVSMKGNVLALRTLIGVNKYKRNSTTLVYNNLFLFSYADAEDWHYCIPFTFCSRDKDGNYVAERYFLLRWNAPKLDLALPTEADVEYYEVAEGRKTSVKNYHAKVAFSQKSVTIGDEVLECVQLFADKMLVKQYGKTEKMYSKFLSAQKGKAEDVMEGVSLAPNLLAY